MAVSENARDAIRRDLALIADMITDGARVLDVGCGDGALLDFLARNRQVDGRGLELSHANVTLCAARGLAVIQGDAEEDLEDYADDAFDFVVLSDTLQATEDPAAVMRDLTRIGRRAVISFLNYGHWSLFAKRARSGRTPRTSDFPEPWWATPAIRPCTILDFRDLVAALDLRVERAVSIDRRGRIRPLERTFWPTIRARRATFLVSRR